MERCLAAPQYVLPWLQVVVALIDTGFNFEHEDVQGAGAQWAHRACRAHSWVAMDAMVA